jgi:hypothetical protein
VHRGRKQEDEQGRRLFPENRRKRRKTRENRKTQEHTDRQTDREEKLKRCPEHAITIVFDLVSPHQVSFLFFHSPFSFAL